MTNKVLLVDRDQALTSEVCSFFERHKWEAHSCGSAEEALDLVDSLHPDLLLTEHVLPGISGTELAQRLRESDPAVKVIVMSDDRRAGTAVNALKAGARDYLVKPLAEHELQLIMAAALATEGGTRRCAAREARQAAGGGLDAMLGSAPAMLELKATISRLVQAAQRMVEGSFPAVLVQGETGTGKELVARALHAEDPSRHGPLVEINCASIPAHLLESELFGFERGSFTDAKTAKAGLVEAADGGTLFLDEVGEIDPIMQAKLLKLLEEKTVRRLGAVTERKVNVRIVSATNRNLEQMVHEGRFRSDLYYRLRVVSLSVPPLRARGADIVLLARHFLALHGRRYGKHHLSFSAEAERALLQYDWPGNVRELRNMLEQTVLLTPTDVIEPAQMDIRRTLAPRDGVDSDHEIERGRREVAASDRPAASAQMPRYSDLEADLVRQALVKTDWNVTKSARLLGLSRDMLRYRIERLKLERPDRQPDFGEDSRLQRAFA